jgi:hypothetical protein
MSEDTILNKLVEHDEQFSKLVTIEEFQKFKNEMFNGQDKMMTILQRLDEERIFTNKWIKDIEDKVETNRVEIQNLKLRLNVS